jgi:hypothetical protein
MLQNRGASFDKLTMRNIGSGILQQDHKQQTPS